MHRASGRDRQGVFRHRVNGIELTPPACLLKYPLKKGETWETESTIGNEPLKIKGTVIAPGRGHGAGGEVPGFPGQGRNLRRRDAFRAVTFWFAPDVGVVKQVTAENAGKNVTAELEESEARA